MLRRPSCLLVEYLSIAVVQTAVPPEVVTSWSNDHNTNAADSCNKIIGVQFLSIDCVVAVAVPGVKPIQMHVGLMDNLLVNLHLKNEVWQNYLAETYLEIKQDDSSKMKYDSFKQE